VTVPAIDGGGVAAVQSRINEIQARFAGDSAGFGAVLANQMGGLRTASSFAGGSFGPGSPPPPGTRLPAGLSPAVDVAQQFLGVPYVWGGESPSGFDCSGLVQYAFGQLGVTLPRTAAEQARVGQPVASLADARPGDLLAFHTPVDHIGIYAGNGLMVVAPKTGDVVKVQAVYDEPTAIRRILPASPATGTGLAGLSVESGGVAAQRSGLLAALSLGSGDVGAQSSSLLAAISSFAGAAS
jgi:cell wall-associated NlpC family hydrolase